MKCEYAGAQEDIRKHFERELAAHESGMYRQSPQHWLATSWQGDALQVMIAMCASLLCLTPRKDLHVTAGTHSAPAGGADSVLDPHCSACPFLVAYSFCRCLWLHHLSFRNCYWQESKRCAACARRWQRSPASGRRRHGRSLQGCPCRHCSGWASPSAMFPPASHCTPKWVHS